MTYTLVMIVLIWNGNSSTGGPVAIDGFKTKEVCEAFASKYTATLPKRFDRGSMNIDTRNNIEHFTCIKKEHS